MGALCTPATTKLHTTTTSPRLPTPAPTKCRRVHADQNCFPSWCLFLFVPGPLFRRKLLPSFLFEGPEIFGVLPRLIKDTRALYFRQNSAFSVPSKVGSGGSFSFSIPRDETATPMHEPGTNTCYALVSCFQVQIETAQEMNWLCVAGINLASMVGAMVRPPLQRGKEEDLFVKFFCLTPD